MFSLALTVVSTVVLTRILGAADFGFYSICLSWLAMAMTFGQLGMQPKLMREVSYDSVSGYRTLNSILRAGLATVLISASLAVGGLLLLYGVILGHGGTAVFHGLLMAIWIVPAAALGACFRGVLNGHNKPLQAMFFADPLQRGLLLLMLLGLYWLDRPAMSGFTALVFYGLSTVIVSAFALLLMLRSWGAKRVPQESVRRFGRAWLVSGTLIAVVTGLQAMASNLDVMMLGLLSSQAEAGLYRAATRGADFVGFGLAIMAPVFMPRAARAFGAGNFEELKRLSANMGAGAFLIGLLIALPLLLFAEPALSVFGPGFFQVAPAMRVLVIGQLFNAFCGPVAALLMVTRRERLALVSLATSLLVNGVLNYVLIPLYGADGAAMATLAGTVVWNLLMLGIVWRTMRINCSAIAALPGWIAGGA